MLSISLLLFTFFYFITSELLIVVEFFRHGAREPLFDYYDSNTYPSKGELTSVGMRQHYNLGLILRHEYIDQMKFLSQEYDSSELYVSSTNLNRTITSALSQLYGLYPLGTGPQMSNLENEKLYEPPFEKNDSLYKYPSIKNNEALPSLFQPIPIHNTGLEDLILRPYDKNICSLNEEWQNSQINTVFFNELMKELNTTIGNVKKMMNLTNDINGKDVAAIYDVFQNDIWAGKPLPEDFKGDLKKNMTFIYDFWVYYVFFGTERQKLTLSGGLFEEINYYFNGKLEGNQTKKWLMYSAHDTTLMMILSALNLSNYECILSQWKTKQNQSFCFHLTEYAANILMELHRIDGKAIVKIRYNGKYIKTYTYAEFERILKKSINAMNEDREYLRICKKNNEKLSILSEGFVRINEIGIVLATGILIGIFISYCFCYYRSKLMRRKLKLLDMNEKTPSQLIFS